MRKFIIDTDPGIDDAFALITAFSMKDIRVMGITTVAGNKGIEHTTQNAQKLIKLMNYDCKVYKGASESLLKVADNAGATHGSDGLGGVELDYDESSLSNMSAVDFILESVRNNPDEIEIVTIGPVTNIALAIRKDMETMKKVKSIYSMGGGFSKSNVTPTSEFNFWFDAQAAKELFDLGEIVPVHMISLDVTHKTIFTANDIQFMKLIGGDLGEILYQMSVPYMAKYWGFNKYIGCVIHDLLTFIYAIDKSICPNNGIKHVNMTLSTDEENIGQTIIDKNNQKGMPKNSMIPLRVDSRKFKETFFEIVFGTKAKDLFNKYVS